MYNSAFYKLSAREQLKNNYWPAVLCAIVCMVPSYFVTRLTLIALSANVSPAVTQLLSVAVQIFVVNILTVGFIRYLMKLKPREERSFGGYDYNMVFSGYRMNFKRTLAATFMRQLKMFLWSLLTAVPTIAGIVLFIVFVPVQQLKTFVDTWLNTASNPTNDNIIMFSKIIQATIPHLAIYMFIWLGTTAALVVLLVRKSYRYMMIPYIMAEYPDMTCKQAFRRTNDIMLGYRFRYFCVQLSFIGYIILVSLIYTITGSLILYCLAQAVMLPYQYMTYSHFYRQRNEIIEYNINKYGDHTEQETTE